jgi:DNA-binding transcriptional ArsR family regulator
MVAHTSLYVKTLLAVGLFSIAGLTTLSYFVDTSDQPILSELDFSGISDDKLTDANVINLGNNTNVKEGNFTIYNWAYYANSGYNEILKDSNGDFVIWGYVEKDIYYPPIEILPPLIESDIFLMKMNNQGEVLWSTQFGGSDREFFQDVVIDVNNHITIRGDTRSTDLIVRNEIYANRTDDQTIGFIASFDTNGHLLFSTYYKGITHFAVDNYGEIWVVEYDEVDQKSSIVKITSRYEIEYMDHISIGGAVSFEFQNMRAPYSSYNSMFFDREDNLHVIGKISYDVELNSLNAFQIDKGNFVHGFFALKMDYRGNLVYNTYIGNNYPFTQITNRYDDLSDEGITNVFLDSHQNLHILKTIQREGEYSYREIHKINPNGELIWNRIDQIELGDWYASQNGAFNSNDEIVLLNNYIDRSAVSSVYLNSTTTKIDIDGNVVWSRSIFKNFDASIDAIHAVILSGLYDLSSQKIIIDDNDDAYISWMAQYEDRGIPETSNKTLELYKINNDGNIAWNYNLINVTEGQNNYIGMQFDNEGNIILPFRSGNEHLNETNGYDVLIRKLNPDGKLIYQTIFGGSGNEIPQFMEISDDNDIVLIGITHSLDFTLKNQIQGAPPDNFYGGPGFITIISPDGEIQMSTYLITIPSATITSIPQSDQSEDFRLVIIGISFLSFLGLTTQIIRSYPIVSREQLKVTNGVKQVISPLFNNDTSLFYLLWGMTHNKISDDTVKNEISKEIFNFKYFFQPVRLSILKLLTDNVSLISSDIRIMLGVSWNEFSSHLKSLEKKELIIITEEFVDGIPKKVVRIGPKGIRIYDEFRSLLTEFLSDKTIFENLIEQGTDLRDQMEGNDSLYPED